MTSKGKRRSATLCVAAAVILAWCLVPTTDCLRLKKTERRGGRKEADAATKRVQQGTIVFGRAFEEGSDLRSPVTDGNQRSNVSVEEAEVTYQADSAGWTRGQTRDAGSREASWKRLSSTLQCGGDHLKFRAVGPGASQFELEQGNAPPMPLSQVPSSCGYSIHRNSFALVMLAPYDGCNMVQQGENYVLPMRWQGIPVSLWCPKGVTDTPTAPPTVDPAKQPEGSKYPQIPFFPPWFPHFQPPLPVTTAAPTTATAAPTMPVTAAPATPAVPVTATAAPTTIKSIFHAKQPEGYKYSQFPVYPPWFPFFQPPLPVATAAPTTAPVTAAPTTTTTAPVTAAPTTTTTAPVTAAPTTTKLIVPAKQPERNKYSQFPVYPPWFPFFQPPLPVATAAPTTPVTAAPTTTTAAPVTAAPTTTKLIVPAKQPERNKYSQFPVYPPWFQYSQPPFPVATAAPTTATAAPITAAPTTIKSIVPAKRPDEPPFPQFPFYPPMFPYFQPPFPVKSAAPLKNPEVPHFPQFPFYPPMVPYFHSPLSVTAPATTTTTPPTTSDPKSTTTTTSKPAASYPPQMFPLPPYIPQLPWPLPGSLPGPLSREFPPYMPVYANYPPYGLPPPFPPFGFSHYQYPTPKPETVPTTTPTTTVAAAKTTVKQSPPDFHQVVYPSSQDALPFFPYGNPFGPLPL